MDATYRACKIENQIFIEDTDNLVINLSIEPYSRNPCGELLIDEDGSVNKLFESDKSKLIAAIKESDSFIFAGKKLAKDCGFHQELFIGVINVSEINSFNYLNWFQDFKVNSPNYFFVVHSIKLSLGFYSGKNFSFRLNIEKIAKSYIPIDSIMRSYYINQIFPEL